MILSCTAITSSVTGGLARPFELLSLGYRYTAASNRHRREDPLLAPILISEYARQQRQVGRQGQ